MSKVIQFKNGYKIIFEDKTIYYNSKGAIHREGGPAVIYENGRELWCLDGKPHRVGGPAVIATDYDWWFLYGQPHRVDGPASICYQKNSLLWYIKGVYYPTMEEWFKALTLDQKNNFLFKGLGELNEDRRR